MTPADICPPCRRQLCYVPSAGIEDSAMKRREFIGLIGGAAVLPLVVQAQQQAVEAAALAGKQSFRFKSVYRLLFAD
jgi:hypothetical protein